MQKYQTSNVSIVRFTTDSSRGPYNISQFLVKSVLNHSRFQTNCCKTTKGSPFQSRKVRELERRSRPISHQNEIWPAESFHLPSFFLLSSNIVLREIQHDDSVSFDVGKAYDLNVCDVANRGDIFFWWP